MTAETTRRMRLTTLIFLAACMLLASGAVIVGVNDNLPGAVLAFAAACAFVLAFAHRWRKPRKFLRLLLWAVVGSVLFILMMIGMDLLYQNPSSPGWVAVMFDHPICEGLTVAFTMLCPAALLVGAVGALVTVICRRKDRKG